MIALGFIILFELQVKLSKHVLITFNFLTRSTSHATGQNAFEPPWRLSNVAPSWCPDTLKLHSVDVWLQPLCVQQYLSVLLQVKEALSGDFLEPRVLVRKLLLLVVVCCPSVVRKLC